MIVCPAFACALTCPRGPLLLAVTARPGQPRIVGAAAGGKHSLLWDASGRLFGMGCAASLGLHGKWLHAQENAYDGNRVSSLLNSRSISIHLSARVCVSVPPLRPPTVLCAMLYTPGAMPGDVLTPHFIPLEEACWMALYGGGAPSDDALTAPGGSTKRSRSGRPLLQVTTPAQALAPPTTPYGASPSFAHVRKVQGSAGGAPGCCGEPEDTATPLCTCAARAAAATATGPSAEVDEVDAGSAWSSQPCPLATRFAAVATASAGWQHCVAVTQDGAVFSFGVGLNGQLGLGDDVTRVKCPQRVHVHGPCSLATATPAPAPPPPADVLNKMSW